MTVAKAVQAGAWSAIDVALRQGLQFGITIALARLLMPEEFGIYAIMALFTSLAVVFVHGGLTIALVQRNHTSREQESTVFWLNLSASIAFALFLVSISSFVASFFGYAVLEPLLALAALQIVLSALGSVQSALLTRDLKFGTLTKAGVASTFGSGVFAVWAAASGVGVWSLGIQAATMAAISSAMLWIVSGWRPLLRVNLRDVRPLLGFGTQLGILSILEILFSQSFTLVIGKLFGMRELGFFTRAVGTQALPSTILMGTISRVALPLFAGRKDDPAALARGLRMAQSWATLINLPMMVGLAILSDLMLICLFGAKWASASTLLSILAIGGILTPLHSLNIQLLMGLGLSKTVLNLGLRKMAVGLVCLGTGAIWGLEGIAYALVFNSLLGLMLNTWSTGKVIGYGFGRQIWDLRGIVLASAVMAVAVWLLKPYLHMSPWVNLTALTAFGATVYMATGLVSRSVSFHQAIETLRMTVGARSGSKAVLA